MIRPGLAQLKLLGDEEAIPVPPEQRSRLIAAVAELLIAEAAREVSDDES